MLQQGISAVVLIDHIVLASDRCGTQRTSTFDAHSRNRASDKTPACIEDFKWLTNSACPIGNTPSRSSFKYMRKNGSVPLDKTASTAKASDMVHRALSAAARTSVS